MPSFYYSLDSFCRSIATKSSDILSHHFLAHTQHAPTKEARNIEPMLV